MFPIRPFRFWSYKVLPLVYDDSLSYYEVLSKLTGKVNEMVSVINSGYADALREYLNDLFAEAMYRSDDECIVITIKEV